jgi:hypothetical protein
MPEASKQKGQVRRIIEGENPLRDYNGGKDKPVFETFDLDEWEEYAKKKTLININGQKPCAMCGESVYYERLPAFIKPICDECQTKLDKGSKLIKLKKNIKAEEYKGDTNTKND